MVATLHSSRSIRHRETTRFGTELNERPAVSAIYPMRQTMFIKHERHFNIWIHSQNVLAEKLIKRQRPVCSLLFNQSNHSNFCLINYQQKCRFQTVSSGFRWFQMLSNAFKRFHKLYDRVCDRGSLDRPVRSPLLTAFNSAKRLPFFWKKNIRTTEHFSSKLIFVYLESRN